ncbi:MAG: nucleotidyltransferase domain-containing protein [Thermoguttaceae bacterium]|nr:nucleotidyltransferase domain-containing protein [Thermoguttaceae bacterium]
METGVLSLQEITQCVTPLAKKYKIAEVYVFGSYARNEATSESDVDFLVFGGKDFKLTSIFAFAEDIRNTIQKDVDVYEIHEINVDSPFYKRIMKERVLLA